MMMPANFSAVAENEMTYVVGGSLVDVLAPAMTTANWQNVSTNVIKIVGNAFIANNASKAFNTLFDGYYVPGDIVGGLVGSVASAYKKGASALAGEWAMGLGVLNAGMSILGGLSAIYTLGSSPIGLETKGQGLTFNAYNADGTVNA